MFRQCLMCLEHLLYECSNNRIVLFNGQSHKRKRLPEHSNDPLGLSKHRCIVCRAHLQLKMCVPLRFSRVPPPVPAFATNLRNRAATGTLGALERLCCIRCNVLAFNEQHAGHVQLLHLARHVVQVLLLEENLLHLHVCLFKGRGLVVELLLVAHLQSAKHVLRDPLLLAALLDGHLCG